MEASNVQKDVKPHIVLMESSITATSPRPVAAAFSGKTARFPAFSGRKTATILLKSFSLNSRRSARAAVTHPAAPA